MLMSHNCKQRLICLNSSVPFSFPFFVVVVLLKSLYTHVSPESDYLLWAAG